jgi:small GTP-binding protein
MNENKDNLNIQPTINIGTVGVAAGGKSTLAEILVGKKTQMHTKELTGQHTINICFANSFIYKDERNKSFIPNKKQRKKGLENYKIDNCFSLIDCPGHSELLLKTLASIELMDAVFVIVPLNEEIEKQSELLQHLLVVKAMNIKKIIVLLNKIDLINDKNKILEKKRQVQELFSKLEIEPCSYIPTSLSKGVGVDYLIEDLNKHFFISNNNDKNIDDLENPLIILRSWDINSVHVPYHKVKPGVIGGTGGSYQNEEKVIILPGYVNNGTFKPYELTINTMETDRKPILEKSKKGGLVGISFYELDPTISKNNQLVGNIMCSDEYDYQIYSELSVKIDLFPIDKIISSYKPKVNQKIYCIINAKTREGTITQAKKNNITFKLEKPICAIKNKFILLTNENNQYIPVGLAEIKKGKKLKRIN